MTWRLALRSLLSRPVRSATLAGGFGLGIAVMAGLLGIGEVILEQARSPALDGGGQLVITGATGRVAHARWLISSVLAAPPLGERVAVAAPRALGLLYLLDEEGAHAIHPRGGIPSLERALGDPETAAVAAWTDTPADREWAAPDPGDVLRALDRFHPIPDVPARVDSWAEWLYFNGRAGDVRFYLTFLAGPRNPNGSRRAGVRLELDRAGRRTSHADSADLVEAELLAHAPDLRVGRSELRLKGESYRIALDFPARAGEPALRGRIVLEARAGRSIPPLEVRGAGGWVSGYVVPVLSGALSGSLELAGETIALDGGTGYHDHNWGFWEGVSWQWGQVAGDELAIVFGRLLPPADAADAARVPAFLAALGPDGPVGFSTRVSIDERLEPGANRPAGIVVRGRGAAVDLTLDLRVDEVTRSATDAGLDFLQLRATYRVHGSAGGRRVDFTAPGAAETWAASGRH
jgi:hypothetical protein